jgi:hypothetical protein
MYQNEIMWRIRLILSDDPRSHALFHQALADQAVSAVRLLARDTGKAEITGEVMIGLGQGEPLGTLLGALHVISPQVFVTRADPPAAPATSHKPRVPSSVPH